MEASALAKEHGCHSTAALDLVGEIKQSGTGAAKFQRGVAEYPAIGDLVMAVGARELRLVFNVTGDFVIEIGHLQQDTTIGAYVNVDDMLSKHFAVLGTTGVGKSSGVALILQEMHAGTTGSAHLPARRRITNTAGRSANRRRCSIRAT